MEGGSATSPDNFVSPPSTKFPVEDPQPRVLPNFGGGFQRLQRARSLFYASHPSIKPPTAVHESPQYIVVEESPPPAPQPNPVGPISPPLSPRQGAYIEHVNGIPYLIRTSCGGGSGGGAFFQRGGACTRCCAPNAPVLPSRGALWSPLWPGGLLAEAVAGHLLLVRVGVPCSNILGVPLNHGGRLS